MIIAQRTLVKTLQRRRRESLPDLHTTSALLRTQGCKERDCGSQDSSMHALCVSKPSGSDGEWHAHGARKIAGQGLKEKNYMPPRMKLLSSSANETSLTSLHLMKLCGTEVPAPAFKPTNYTPAAPPQIYSSTEQPMQLVPDLVRIAFNSRSSLASQVTCRDAGYADRVAP